MRTGLTISSAGHALLLAWGLITLATHPFEMTNAESFPVDVISESDFSQMMAGSKTAPPKEAPKPLVDKVAPPEPAKQEAPKVSDKQEIQTASAEAVPPAPKTPPDKKVEAKPDEIAEALKKEAAKKPPPPKKPPQPKLDLTKVESRLALIDRRDQQRNAATGAMLNPTPSLGVPTANAPRLSQSEIDALRAQIQACWNPPSGVMDAKELIVRVRLQLNQDGSLKTDPVLTNTGSDALFQVAAQSALRAIKRCQPYRLPIAKYDAWKDVDVTFDPRDMYRG